MRKVDYPTPSYLRQCFDYRDGRIFWKKRPLEHFKSEASMKRFNARWAGMEAGYLNEALHFGARWMVRVDNVQTYRGIIVWYLFNDEIIPPDTEVDHEDRNKINDKIENLRLATSQENKRNKSVKKNRKHDLPKGVYPTKLGTYFAKMIIDRKFKYLGIFKTPEDAHQAYMKAAEEHFGKFATDGALPEKAE